MPCAAATIRSRRRAHEVGSLPPCPPHFRSSCPRTMKLPLLDEPSPRSCAGCVNVASRSRCWSSKRFDRCHPRARDASSRRASPEVACVPCEGRLRRAYARGSSTAAGDAGRALRRRLLRPRVPRPCAGAARDRRRRVGSKRAPGTSDHAALAATRPVTATFATILRVGFGSRCRTPTG
jgi:hypothetical protein